MVSAEIIIVKQPRLKPLKFRNFQNAELLHDKRFRISEVVQYCDSCHIIIGSRCYNCIILKEVDLIRAQQPLFGSWKLHLTLLKFLNRTFTLSSYYSTLLHQFSGSFDSTHLQLAKFFLMDKFFFGSNFSRYPLYTTAQISHSEAFSAFPRKYVGRINTL